ncbi:MAG: hypothetical protein FJY56_19645 [Betaproteobacteria bacterium]|nr:hypothetical protein [Betaproteobacteria bacterium]
MIYAAHAIFARDFAERADAACALNIFSNSANSSASLSYSVRTSGRSSARALNALRLFETFILFIGSAIFRL